MLRIYLRTHRWLFFLLFSMLQCSLFWLGRLSVQINMIERNSLNTMIGQEVRRASLATYLMVLIMTKPEEAGLRDVIRQTWLRLSSKTPEKYRHLFVIGTKGLEASTENQLNAESDKNGDLLLLRNLTDSYQKLTAKTLLAIGFAVDGFDFRFLLKVDGDSFVRLGSLLKSLRDIEHTALYWGFLDGRARPFAKGKWREEEWRLCDFYLPYQLGGGYVLARSLAEYIARNKGLLKLFGSEDVSVGAWLAGLEVRYVHDPRFDTEWKSRGCHNEYLITHKKSAAEMRQLFDNVANRGQLCFPGEYRLRPSYIYDFSRPPSECCTRRNGSRIP